MKKACLISFEGIECSGKSLQSQRLKDYCDAQKIPAVLIREPGSTAIGEEIRKILLYKECSPSTELLLFLAARSELLTKKIIPELEKGSIVICDRYFHSTLAYQGYGRNIDLSSIKKISSLLSLNIEPTQTFLLQPPYEILKERLLEKQKSFTLDRIESSREDILRYIYTGFEKIAEEYPYIYKIESMASEDEIHAQILVTFKKILNTEV